MFGIEYRKYFNWSDITAFPFTLSYAVIYMPILYISIPRWQDKIESSREIEERPTQRCILVRRKADSDVNADSTRVPLRCYTSRWQSNTVQRCIRMHQMKRVCQEAICAACSQGCESRFFDCDLFARKWTSHS